LTHVRPLWPGDIESLEAILQNEDARWRRAGSSG